MVLEYFGDESGERCILQSFEVASLQFVKWMLPNVRTILLMSASGGGEGEIEFFSHRPFDFVASGDKRTYSDLLANAEYLHEFVDILGPDKSYLYREKVGITNFIQRAHSIGFPVHAYNFSENPIGWEATRAGRVQEVLFYAYMGLDGFFTDDPECVAEALESVNK